MGRRLVALFIDWILCSLIVVLFIRPATHLQAQGLTLGIFTIQDVLFTALTGFTVGKLALRIRVARLDGKIVGLLWAFVRTLMLLLIAPPLIADDDLRGLQDRASNTVVVRV
jgi:RDD family